MVAMASEAHKVKPKVNPRPFSLETASRAQENFLQVPGGPLERLESLRFRPFQPRRGHQSDGHDPHGSMGLAPRSKQEMQ